jgi:small subunit ribosomal protein S6
MAEAAKELRLREYEAIYILRADVMKEAAEKVALRVQEVVTREGGKLTRVENWGRRALAYEIGSNKRGIYVYVTYLGHGALVAELERNFRMLDEVIRFQTVKLHDEPGDKEVDAEEVKFHALPDNVEDEEELTIEQQLGLVDGPRRFRQDSSDNFDLDMDEEMEDDE